MRATLLACLALLGLVLGAAAPATANPAAGATADTGTAAGDHGVESTAGASSGGPAVAASVEETRARASAQQEADDACEAVAGGEQRPNPAEDTLGWENGCWHDDPIAVTVDDGLNETELEAVVARTMARVEFVRELEFEETVPVEVVSREEFRERTAGRYDNVSEAERLHQNVKHEALFFVPEDEDAIAQLEANTGGTVLGYYAPGPDRIVVVSDSDGPLRVDGPTLAHELAHALQDQQFNLSRYDRSTTEQNNAVSGLLEGDPTYTEFLYRQRCGEQWDCPSRDSGSGGPPGSEFDWGIYFMGFQPYSDGGPFVQQLRQEGGWEAVNAAYENPPASSEQVMYPEKYPEETPANVTVPDRSDDAWRILELEGGVNYAVYGEAGMASMFISPTFDDREPVFVERNDIVTGDELNLVEYSIPETDGWNGDKLYPYVRNDSAATNETGYVWKTEWDTRADAREFATAYVELLEFHEAEAVAGRENTYRIPDDEPYGDAFYLNRTGKTVVVVNAPDVDELANVRRGAAPETPATATPTSPATPTGGGATATVPPDGDGDEGTPAATTTTSPGFGVPVALAAAAALAVAALARRRRR